MRKRGFLQCCAPLFSVDQCYPSSTLWAGWLPLVVMKTEWLCSARARASQGLYRLCQYVWCVSCSKTRLASEEAEGSVDVSQHQMCCKSVNHEDQHTQSHPWQASVCSFCTRLLSEDASFNWTLGMRACSTKCTAYFEEIDDWSINFAAQKSQTFDFCIFDSAMPYIHSELMLSSAQAARFQPSLSMSVV
jgi:hypothetical protein